MQYQRVKVEAVIGTEEEPLLYSVASENASNEAIEALKLVDWGKVFPNMCPYDIGTVTLSASYMDSKE